MFNLADTIAAICTPKGTGAIAAIRISGPDSWGIAKKIFLTVIPAKAGIQSIKASDLSLDSHENGNDVIFQHMQALHGFIKDGENMIDEVIVLPFKSPNSFTTEDIIEIFCHGGLQVSSMILDLCLNNGARLAKPGEFTFRAFVNGRIDLTKAEAINEIVNAMTEKSVKAASEMVSGSLKKKVQAFREKVYSLITSLEGGVEFPLDVEPIDKNKLKIQLQTIKQDLTSLINASKEGHILRDGIRLSIIGEPNVGKSSLLNQFLENERAIVTDVPGTTRDTIEEKTILDGWPIVLIDTAGIREHKYADDPERHGIERSKRAIKSSDIVLFVKDLSKKSNNGLGKEILEDAKDKTKIVVGNKIDLVETSHGMSLRSNDCDIEISAKLGTNIGELKKLLIQKVQSSFHFGLGSQSIFVNERQKGLLEQVVLSIDFALKQLEDNLPDDFIADELKKAITKLDEMSGKSVNEEVIKSIFARFCIGK